MTVANAASLVPDHHVDSLVVAESADGTKRPLGVITDHDMAVEVVAMHLDPHTVDMPRIVAFVMAGGEGRRLRPYTAACPKPALPFGESCRIVDFALSNLYNSEIRSIYVLTQYRAKAILDHISNAWMLPETGAAEFVQAIVPMRGADGRSGFKGTADAVRQNLHLLAYDFGSNRIPNLRPCEERGYWRDVGTVQAYEAAQRDAAGPSPRVVLDNPQWPICPLVPQRRAFVASASRRDAVSTPERPVGLRGIAGLEGSAHVHDEMDRADVPASTL